MAGALAASSILSAITGRSAGRSTSEASHLMTVRAIEPAEWPEWARMRAGLWPDHTAAEHEADMPKWAARDDTVVLVVARPDGRLCGFAEVGTRPYADGC